MCGRSAACGVEVQQKSSDLQEATNVKRVEYCLFAVKRRGTGTSALPAVPLSERFSEDVEAKGQTQRRWMCLHSNTASTQIFIPNCWLRLMLTFPANTQCCHCFHVLCNYFISSCLWAGHYLTRRLVSKKETITVDPFSHFWTEKNVDKIKEDSLFSHLGKTQISLALIYDSQINQNVFYIWAQVCLKVFLAAKLSNLASHCG